MQSTAWIGLDIGGANLKLSAPGLGAVESSFPLWQRCSELESELRTMIEQTPTGLGVAVTMTGELADCFESKVVGVRYIVNAVQKAGESQSDRRGTVFYSTTGGWLSALAAAKDPLSVAAANWHALARFASRFLPNDKGFLIDIGSTTTDIIPLDQKQPVLSGLTDADRLRRSQLTYTGVARSSLAGLISDVDFKGTRCKIANELFATIQDAYLWLNLVPEKPDCTNTADGRPATRPHAGQRMARLLCSDVSEVGHDVLESISSAAHDANLELISNSIHTVMDAHPSLPASFVVSGQGAWLAQMVLAQHPRTSLSSIISLETKLDAATARAAAAHAVAVLANETINEDET